MKKPLKRKIHWQPSLDEFPADLASFEVFRTRKAGREAYPKVKVWVGYRAGQIENPTIRQ